MKRVLPLLFVLLHTTLAQQLLPPIASNHLVHALQARDMTLADLHFDRDIAEPNFVLPITRKALKDPLYAVQFGEQALHDLAVSNQTTGIWSLLADIYDYSVPTVTLPQQAPTQDLDSTMASFLEACEQARAQTEEALAGVSADRRVYSTAALLINSFGIETNSQELLLLEQLGINSNYTARVFTENEWLDVRKPASNHLETAKAVDYGKLAGAAHYLDKAAAVFIDSLRTMNDWPEQVLTHTSNGFSICIGTIGADTYSEPCDIIIDPGGDDIYANVGSANGLLGSALNVIVDLDGDDLYRDELLLGCASALWGLAAVFDIAGDDTYRADYSAQGCGLFGIGMLSDAAGKDIYSAGAMAQGAGCAGAGILRDSGGNDLYSVNVEGQAYANVLGVGLLLEYGGNDVYTAGRVEQDFERHWENHVSLAQGFATGQRPGGGGGVAILFDAEGNDSYLADVYGQGVSYWYSIGMLIDVQGHDTYRIHEYGQGSGIHLSTALLADLDGNDFYTGFSLAQGSAHDYGVGMLFDIQGNDNYTAERQSQGLAINNSFAMLMDQRGEDAYFARDNGSCQGIGNFPHMREYGSLALLLDLANFDRYTCGATNGGTLLRPFYGVVYDVYTNYPTHSAVPKDDLPAPDLSDWTYDELMRAASRYGDTEKKRVWKSTAAKQIKQSPEIALPYLLNGLEKENMWYFIYADNTVRESDPEQTASVLLDILSTSEIEEQQKFSIYLLGYHHTPEHINQVTPWITNEHTAAVTMRTLGKWHATNTVDLITPFLQNTNERRRIIAANALHDIRSADALPALTNALNDSVFTVREAVKRALTNLLVNPASAHPAP